MLITATATLTATVTVATVTQTTPIIHMGTIITRKPITHIITIMEQGTTGIYMTIYIPIQRHRRSLLSLQRLCTLVTSDPIPTGTITIIIIMATKTCMAYSCMYWQTHWVR